MPKRIENNIIRRTLIIPFLLICIPIRLIITIYRIIKECLDVIIDAFIEWYEDWAHDIPLMWK